MKYFEIRKITKKEYFDKTNDPYYDTPFEQSLIPVNGKVYCATKAETVDFNVHMFDKERSNDRNKDNKRSI